MQYTYTYDAVNRLSTEELGGVTKTFTYDVRSQLTGDGTGTYGYDNAGNRNNSSQTITTGNRLDLDANWDYSYDDEGNLTGKVSVAMPTVTWTYTWDVNNRMVAAVKSAGSNLYSVDYKYDVFGNRIEQIEDADGAGAGASVTTRFAWEGAGVLQDAWGNRTSPVGTENWNIWADLNGSNGLVMRYVRGDEVDQLFSRVKADGTVAHYLTDRMQSTRQMLDASGTVANTITYDGFGNVLSETDAPFGDRWKWTGREYNNYTGLQYNRARYFSGESGRWASEDPKRHSGMEPYNLHRYLGNHTVGLNDSSGNDWAGLPGGGPPLHFLPDTGTPPPEMPPLPPRPPGTIAHPVTGEPMVIPDMHILRPRPIDPIFNRDDPKNSDDPNRYPPLLPGQPGERPPPGTPGTPGGPGEPSIVLQSKLLELAIDKFVDDSNLTTGSLKELPYARKIIPFYNFLIDLIPSKYLPRPPATGNPDPGFPRPVPGFPGPSVGVSGVSKNGATIKIER